MAFARTIRDLATGSWTFSAGWTNDATPWGLVGATAKYATAATATASVSLASGHGFTGGAFIGMGYGGGTTNAQVDVDGVVYHAAWNQKTGSNTSDSRYYQPRIRSFPFLLTPAGVAQVPRLTAGADGGRTYLFGIVLFTASAPVSGRVLRTGHSMEYPVLTSVSLGPNLNGHGQKFIPWLNASGYNGQTNWTDYNTAVPSENHIGGSQNSGLAGGPNGAGAYPQFTNQTMYDNIAILTPGWMRHEAANLWPNTGGHAPRLGSALFTTDAQYMAGVAQWAGALFQYGIYMVGVNDAGLISLFDDPPDGNAAGGCALQQIQTCTPTGTPNVNFHFLWNGNTSALCSFANTVANIQSCLNLATPSAIPFTVSGAAGSPLAAGGAGVTFTNNSYGPTVASITNDYAGNGTETMATTQAGRAKVPGGAGYAVKAFTDRVRGDLIEAALAITPAPRIAILGSPNVLNGAYQAPVVYPGSGSLVGAYEQLDNALKGILEEPWIRTITGGTPFYFVPLRAATTGYPSNVSSGDAHPSDAGHAGILRALIDAHERTSANAYRPTGVYNGGVS